MPTTQAAHMTAKKMPLPNDEYDPTVDDPELCELQKIRDAAWRSHEAAYKTGTCEFLDILLRVQQAMAARTKELGAQPHPPATHSKKETV